jgi:queuine tRNA-ribosyltransferase
MAALRFQLEHTDNNSKARAGTISTDHGIIETPIFMPVGTIGSVKAVTQRQLKDEIKAQIILGNTYHLYLRPTTAILKRQVVCINSMAGTNPFLRIVAATRFFHWQKTGSLTEEGALFQSHIDGSRHLFTAENVMDIQRNIGADIIMAFDECPPYPVNMLMLKKAWSLHTGGLQDALHVLMKRKINMVIRRIYFRSCRAALMKTCEKNPVHLYHQRSNRKCNRWFKCWRARNHDV